MKLLWQSLQTAAYILVGVAMVCIMASPFVAAVVWMMRVGW